MAIDPSDVKVDYYVSQERQNELALLAASGSPHTAIRNAIREAIAKIITDWNGK